MRRRRTVGLAGVVGVLAVLVAPALPGAAHDRALGHAQLVTSSPGAGDVLDEPPTELRLVFSEPLEAELTSVDVRDDDDRAVVERAGAPDPTDPFTLVAELPSLDDGVYTVTWRTLSAADGHTVEGFFTFGVGTVTLAPSDTSGSSHGETDALDVLARVLTYVGIVAAVGLTAFSRFVLRAGPTNGLLRVVAATLAAAGLATLATAVANGIAAGDAVGYLVDSRTGLLQVGRGIATIVAAVLASALPRSVGASAAAAGGVVITALLVAGGHAAALPGPIPLVAGIVHVLGAAVWFGGVAGLALTAVRPALVTGAGHAELRRLVPRFSALALAAIGLVGTTGVVAAWWHTGTLLDPQTDYGRALLVKTVLAVGALAIGGLNFVDGAPVRRWAGGFGQRVRVEAILGLAVLVATSVLATSSPNEGSAGVAIRPVPDALGQTTPDMTLTLAPGRPGVNRATVRTTDALAMSNLRLELVLDRLDTGTTTRIELHHPGMNGMPGMEGMPGHGGGAVSDDEPGTTGWTADAIVLAAGSRWDANVLTISSADAELGRQRFSFALTDDGVGEGRVGSAITPATIVAVVLLVGGAVAVGLGLAGATLPRSDARTSALALRVGGVVGLLLGVGIGVDAVLRI